MILKAFFLSFVFLFMSSLNAEANYSKKQCLNEADYKHFKKMFKLNTGSAAYDGCDSRNYTYQVIEALKLLESLQMHADTSLVPYPYNQELLGPIWLKTLTDHGTQLLWGPDFDSKGQYDDRNACNNARAFTAPLEFRKNIYLCPLLHNDKEEENYVGSPGVIDIIATLLHEHRHLKGANTGYEHTSDCNERASTCDPSIEYKGSYAVTLEAYAKLGILAKNIHPIMKQSARRSAYSTALSRFKIAPIQEEFQQSRESHLALQDHNGDIYDFSNGRLVRAFENLPRGDVFMTGGGHLDDVLVRTKETPQKIVFESANFIVPLPHIDLSLLNPSPIVQKVQALSPQALASLKTMTSSFSLFSQYVVLVHDTTIDIHISPRHYPGETDQDRAKEKTGLVQIEIPSGEKLYFTNALPQQDNSGNVGIIDFIIDGERAYRIEISRNGFAEIHEVDYPHKGFVQALRADDNTFYFLDSQGTVYSSNRFHQAPNAIPELHNKKFQRLLFEIGRDYRDYPKDLDK